MTRKYLGNIHVDFDMALKAIKKCQNPNNLFCNKELLVGRTPFQYATCQLIT